MEKTVMTKLRMLASVHNGYKAIDCASDLRKAGLTLAEYQMIPLLYDGVHRRGSALTISKNCAGYFKRYGFDVRLDSDGVNYKIGFGDAR